MKKLEERKDGKYITNKKTFRAFGIFNEPFVTSVFDFSYKMTFGEEGKHRDHRSGGTHARKNGEIFANTFQGKLSEFALYNTFCKDIALKTPDLSTWSLGKWDDTDFIANGYNLNIKSTKSFGNLLLLETKDWNEKAQYIPNIEKKCAEYDFFVLVRVNPYCEEIFKINKLLYVNELEKDKLGNLILAQKWEYDIPGFCRKADLICAIKNGNIIRKGEKLNGKIPMDADNYYIQAGDLRDINELAALLKKEKTGL